MSTERALFVSPNDVDDTIEGKLINWQTKHQLTFLGGEPMDIRAVHLDNDIARLHLEETKTNEQTSVAIYYYEIW